MNAESRPWGALASPRIVVARWGGWATVDLRRLYTNERRGAQVVSLADVWVASGLRGDLLGLAFDFLDEDGNAASRPGEPRLDALRFAKGWLDVETHGVTWDATAFVPGHWHMPNVATIVAVNPSKRRRAGR